MELRMESASVAGFDISGGANGLSVTSFRWRKAPRTLRRARPRAHGSVDLTRFYEGRLYELEGLLYGLDEEDAQARLDSFEAAIALDGADTMLQWRLAGRTDDEWANVRVEGDLEYEFAHNRQAVIVWALTLFAGDPRRYGATLRSGSYDPSDSSSGTGVALPITFPIDFVGEAVTALEVTNAGNFPTPPVFTITGPVTNPIIDNETTGESITTQDLALTSSDTAVVDVGAHTFEVNGVNRPDLIDASLTEWFELVSGENRLRLRGSDMVDDQTMLAVSFYDARI